MLGIGFLYKYIFIYKNLIKYGLVCIINTILIIYNIIY